jgi:hypothetical protein
MHGPVIQGDGDAFGLGIVPFQEAEVVIHLLPSEVVALSGNQYAGVDLDAAGNAPMLGAGSLSRYLDVSPSPRIRPTDAGPQVVGRLILIQEREALWILLAARTSLSHQRQFLVVGQIGRMHASSPTLVDHLHAPQQAAAPW